jgi:Mandelate racemase / muconate lactonizing enzyme, N-terminal domain
VPPRWLFVRIETEAGVIGWDEASPEGHSNAVRTVVNQFAEHLIGSDPAHIKDHRQLLTKSGIYRGGQVLGSAVSGIDPALWDIKGKALGVPRPRAARRCGRRRIPRGWCCGRGNGSPLVGDAAPAGTGERSGHAPLSSSLWPRPPGRPDDPARRCHYGRDYGQAPDGHPAAPRQNHDNDRGRRRVERGDRARAPGSAGALGRTSRGRRDRRLHPAHPAGRVGGCRHGRGRPRTTHRPHAG